MKLNTYLNFPGTCAEALDFYTKHLGAKVLMKMTFDQGPEPEHLPPGCKKDHILHAHFQIGDAFLMASDGPPEHVEPMRSAYIAISVESNEEAERIYNVLAEGGKVFMPMGEQFFAYRFGQFRDRFGVNWMVLHPKPRNG